MENNTGQHLTMGSPPRLRRDSDGALKLIRDGKSIAVLLRPCFPWSAPTRFLSLRENENKEVYLINRLEDLDEASRRAVESVLSESTFTLELTAIKKIKREYDLRLWTVETRQGPRRFQTRLDDWPRNLPDGSMVIRDLAGDLYHVATPDALDRRSARLLWSFRD